MITVGAASDPRARPLLSIGTESGTAVLSAAASAADTQWSPQAVALDSNRPRTAVTSATAPAALAAAGASSSASAGRSDAVAVIRSMGRNSSRVQDAAQEVVLANVVMASTPTSEERAWQTAWREAQLALPGGPGGAPLPKRPRAQAWSAPAWAATWPSDSCTSRTATARRGS